MVIACSVVLPLLVLVSFIHQLSLQGLHLLLPLVVSESVATKSPTVRDVTVYNL